MITEQQRQWAENMIRCAQAKLGGAKIIEAPPESADRVMADNDWYFHSGYDYRVAPEPPQEKMKRWVVDYMPTPISSHHQVMCETEDEAIRVVNAEPKGGTIIELTETARIEPETPKKRVPRRIWMNRYSDRWGVVNDSYIDAVACGDRAVETAVEFVEVIK